MQEVGYAGEDEEMWGRMEGGGVSEGEEGGEGGASTTIAPNPPPRQAKPHLNPPKPAPKKRKFSFESSDKSDDGAIPRPKRPKPHHHHLHCTA